MGEEQHTDSVSPKWNWALISTWENLCLLHYFLPKWLLRKSSVNLIPPASSRHQTILYVAFFPTRTDSPPFPLQYQTFIIYCNISPQCDLNVSHMSPPSPACFNHAPGLQYTPLFLCGLTGGVCVTSKQVLFCGSAKSLKSKLKKKQKSNKQTAASVYC